MTHWNRAFSMLACALATAGCTSPAASTSPIGGTWRPQLSLPRLTPPEAPQAAPTAHPATLSGAAAPVVPAPPPVIETGMQYSPSDFICFQSNRRPSAGGFDIYVYDAVQDTVLSLVGVNTPADETNPDISNDGQFLVFQRGVKTGSGVQQDILLYSQRARMVNTLRGLNTADANETQPSLGADGSQIVYVSDEDGYPSIRLYDVRTGDAFQVPGANRRTISVGAPTLSGDGLRIAYEAANAYDAANTDILIYDIPSSTQLTPPFINTAYRERCPDLSADGRRVLFVSDRFGSDDVFEADLDSGFTDNMSFLNTDDDESLPRYLGGSLERVVFQLKTREATPRTALRAFNRQSMQLDTLPIANVLVADSALGTR